MTRMIIKKESDLLFHYLTSYIFYKGERFFTYDELSEALINIPDSSFVPSNKELLLSTIDKICSLSFISHSYRNNGLFFSFPTVITEEQQQDMLSEVFQKGLMPYSISECTKNKKRQTN